MLNRGEFMSHEQTTNEESNAASIGQPEKLLHHVVPCSTISVTFQNEQGKRSGRSKKSIQGIKSLQIQVDCGYPMVPFRIEYAFTQKQAEDKLLFAVGFEDDILISDDLGMKD
ncbi:hypothetical protein ACTXT7_005474 [Hymenolepis weldensis]